MLYQAELLPDRRVSIHTVPREGNVPLGKSSQKPNANQAGTRVAQLRGDLRWRPLENVMENGMSKSDGQELDHVTGPCPSSKHLGLLSLFSNGGSGSSWFDVMPLGVDGSSGGFGWSVS